jgi:capsular exopolysaccharide synthesis family protein
MADAQPTPPAAPRQPNAALEDDIVERRSIRDYYIILRERFWIALPLALLVAIGFAYVKSRAVPVYLSTATMRIEKPETVVTSQQIVDTSINSDIELNTYLQVMSSATMRNRVLASFTPDEIKLLQKPYLATLEPGQEPPPVAAVAGGITVQSVRNSFLVNVSATHRDPQAAALIANRYVEQFMAYLFDNISGKSDYAVDYLHTRAKELRLEANAAEEALLAYMTKNNLVSLDRSVDIVTDRLKTINGALQDARLNRLATEDLYNQVDAFRNEGKNLLELSYISAHGTVPGLRNQLAELARTQSVLSERYLERHPRMIDVANSIAVAQGQLQNAVELAIADLEATLAKAREREISLQREYDEQEKEQFRLRDIGVEFKSLETAAQTAKNQYSEILNRLSQANTSRNLEKVPVRPLDPALAASAPFAPNITSITRTSIILGIAVFFGVAFGLSFIDDRIKSAWDVEHFIGSSLLGIIPDLSGATDREKYRLVLDNQSERGAEAFLGVYSAVKIHSKLDFPKAILVTSTIPGEGKTLVSSNLASAFARHGKRTLLIDCDLRRPMLHRHYEQTNDQGLLVWFERGARFDGPDLATNPDLGILNIGENFSLLRSGGRSKVPTEFLESPAFTQLIDRLKREYDLLVVDSPPLGAVTDSLLIAETTDEVVYVCRFNRALRKHIRLYIKALRQGKNEILGIVLNGLSSRRIEYYSNYRYYRSYKKYYGTTS